MNAAPATIDRNTASRFLIAVPVALAPAARVAAQQWDEAGADSMFRQPTLCRVDDPAARYVFSYGFIANEHAPAIQAAIEAYFPGGLMVAAKPFDVALAQAGLVRVAVDMPPGA